MDFTVVAAENQEHPSCLSRAPSFRRNKAKITPFLCVWQMLGGFPEAGFSAVVLLWSIVWYTPSI